MRAPARQKILVQPGLDQVIPTPTVLGDERYQSKACMALHELGRTESVRCDISSTIHDRC
jgi:hypothetical protein